MQPSNEISPLVSFLVLSYNNQSYIKQTLDSIFHQTVGDFEIILIDDASSDSSMEIVNAYSDKRLRTFVHRTNQGLTPSYNEAVSLCRGKFIVNLDSDDAIHPTKTEKQLAVFEGDGRLEVVGTYINVIDEQGRKHQNSDSITAIINRPQDYNSISNWTVKNNLPRSSTMMSRSLHDRVGPNELGMVRAPDYDLWVRGLRTGTKFTVIPECLTDYRQHARGLTYGDPKATFLELAYTVIKHLVPLIDDRSDYQCLANAMDWLTSDEQFKSLTASGQHRLLGLFTLQLNLENFLKFIDIVQSDEDIFNLECIGRRLLALHTLHSARSRFDELLFAKEWQAQQTKNWNEAYIFEREQHSNWKAAFEFEAEQRRNLKDTYEKLVQEYEKVKSLS